jgi:hypothetical protein
MSSSSLSSGVDVPAVPLPRLDQLRGRVVVWDVEPEAVRHGGGQALPEAERVAAHEVGALSVRVIQRVEEERRGRAEQVLDVLGQRVDVLPRRVLGHEAVVVDGEDVLLLGDHVPKAAARGVLE